MNNNKRRDTLVGLAVLILIVLVVIFLVRRHQDAITPFSSPVPTTVSVYQQQLKNNFGIVVPDTAIKADLKDVSGGNQVGLATLDKATGQNVYTVLANLEDPTPGYFYQAWLVNGNNTISLGQLSIEKGGWLVNYTSSKDLSDHKTVIVTLEKYNDSTPEKHILEGSF